MIIRAISASTTYPDIHLWLTLFIDCLISVGTGLEKLESEGTEALKLKLLRLVRLIDGMTAQRRTDNLEPESTADSREAATENVLKCDASLWSPEEWDKVQYLMEWLSSIGLRRGYISFDRTSSERLEHFARDPDGLCPHSRS
jgi:hypothetical protein